MPKPKQSNGRQGEPTITVVMWIVDKDGNKLPYDEKLFVHPVRETVEQTGPSRVAEAPDPKDWKWR